MLCAIVDCETTNLPYHPEAKTAIQPRAIEFGGVVLDEEGEEVRELSFLCNPGRPIEPVITKITGITNEMLAQEQPFRYYLPEIENFFAGVEIIAAHNLTFDHFFLEHELRLAESDLTLPPLKLCTVEAFEDGYGYRPKLTQLYTDITGHEYKQTHRAVDDVRALAEIIKTEKILELYDDYRCRHLQRQEQAPSQHRQEVQ